MSFKELTVEQWEAELNHGLKFREQYGLEKKWHELEALFYNVSDSQMNAGPNIVLSTGDALLSTLNVPAPYLTLKARRSDYINPARLLETVDNTLIDEMHMPAELETSILSAYLWGSGILKVGFDSEFGWDPTHDMGGTKQPLGMTGTMFNVQGDRIEFDDIRPGMPWVRNVLPHDFVVPWGTKRLNDCAWCAHRVVRHIEDIKADAKYSSKKDLQPIMSMEDFVNSYKSVIKPYRLGNSEIRRGLSFEGKNEFCELWEIHDRRTQKIYVIATGHKKFLRNDQDLIQLEGLPFVGFSFTPRARTFWTTSDAYYLRQCQAELSDITEQATKLRRIMCVKWLVEEGCIDEMELQKMLSTNVGAVVKIKKGQATENSIRPISAPPNYEFANQAQQVRSNARENVGLSRNQTGEYEGSGRRTATEVNVVQQASDNRISRREQVLRDSYISTFKKVNPLIINYWHTPRVIEIVGQNGIPIWQQFVGNQLRGEYEYSVGFSPNDTQDSLASRKQQAIQSLETVGQSPILQQLIDPIKYAQFLANSVNDPEFSSIFRQGVLEGVPSAPIQLSMQQGSPAQGGGAPAGQPTQSQGPMPQMSQPQQGPSVQQRSPQPAARG